MRLICTKSLLVLTLSIGQTAWAKKNSEEECAKYKPDRTVSSEASIDTSASASAKGSIFGGSAAASNASAEKTEKQALSQSELEKQEKIYKACLFYKDGDMSQEQWDIAIAEYMGHAPPSPPAPDKPSFASQAMGALAGAAASQAGIKVKKPKKPPAKLIAAGAPCGRFASLGLHVPSRYQKQTCQDKPGKKGRYVFHSTQGKAATCELLRDWAGANGFSQGTSEMSRAKDTLVVSKSGFPELTIKCVNTPKDSGKPTRLVFMLPPQ
jgi:hypothetical protein